jgi:hypothetical protein
MASEHSEHSEETSRKATTTAAAITRMVLDMHISECKGEAKINTLLQENTIKMEQWSAQIWSKCRKLVETGLSSQQVYLVKFDDDKLSEAIFTWTENHLTSLINPLENVFRAAIRCNQVTLSKSKCKAKDKSKADESKKSDIESKYYVLHWVHKYNEYNQPEIIGISLQYSNSCLKYLQPDGSWEIDDIESGSIE